MYSTHRNFLPTFVTWDIDGFHLKRGEMTNPDFGYTCISYLFSTFCFIFTHDKLSSTTLEAEPISVPSYQNWDRVTMSMCIPASTDSDEAYFFPY